MHHRVGRVRLGPSVSGIEFDPLRLSLILAPYTPSVLACGTPGEVLFCIGLRELWTVLPLYQLPVRPEFSLRNPFFFLPASSLFSRLDRWPLHRTQLDRPITPFVIFGHYSTLFGSCQQLDSIALGAYNRVRLQDKFDLSLFYCRTPTRHW